ncbi:MAG: alpha/beta fold hydrolase [Pseudomonadota bacterium]
MKRVLVWIACGLAGGIALLALMIAVLPREAVVPPPEFDAAALGDDLDAWLASDEAAFDDITPGTEKRIVWAGARGAQTPLSVLYLHGFSATSEEVRPVPDRVAEGLGANLVFWRLTGHGRGGEALGRATAGDWLGDLDQALAVARRAGEEVLVIGTSTGGTLAALAAADPRLRDRLAGVVFLSPNFGLRASAGRILTWPGVRIWGPWLAGPTRGFQPMNAGHREFWTIEYPTVALIPMAQTVEAARQADFESITTPALFLFSDQDIVVSPRAIREAAERWGGAVSLSPITPIAGSDPYFHVIAGDILSPAMTEDVVERILSWAQSADLQAYAKNP